MTILAVYYTLADIVLLGQCFYYRGFTLKDEVSTPAAHTDDEETDPRVKANERTSLLPRQNGHSHLQSHDGAGEPGSSHNQHAQSDRRTEPAGTFLHPTVDGTHLSPATPFIEPTTKRTLSQKITKIRKILSNIAAIALVCAAGILGWYVSPGSKGRDGRQPDNHEEALHFDPLGQTFGYLCAVFYLGSRLPQILLNFRRKSTDGVSLLFFLFACIGNLTYVLSILAYSPVCGGDLGRREPRCRPGEAAALYGRYILVNLSWLLGSLGTLFLDMCIFVQFFLYRGSAEVNGT